MTGVLYGVGVGPGDPELLTLKAVRVLRAVPVLAWPAPLSGDSMARRIAAPHLPGGQVEIALRMSFDAADPDPRAPYESGAAEIAGHLAEGRDVAVLCEGDPLLFGSFIRLLARLRDRFPVEVVSGISSVMAAAAAAGLPLATGEGRFAVLPAGTEEGDLARMLDAVEGGAILKVGRHVAKLRRVLAGAGRLERAVLVEWVGHERQRIRPLAEIGEATAPYFSLVLVPPREDSWW